MKRIPALLLVCSCYASAQPPSFKYFLTFYKPVTKPVLKQTVASFFLTYKNQHGKMQRADVFNPAAIMKNGKVYLFTRREDNPAAAIGGRTSRLGLAVSSNGYDFKQFRERGM